MIVRAGVGTESPEHGVTGVDVLLAMRVVRVVHG
jgi:hypothetical protein